MMMVRVKGKFDLWCDRCPNVLDTGATDASDARLRGEAHGWKQIIAADEERWICPACHERRMKQ